MAVLCSHGRVLEKSPVAGRELGWLDLVAELVLIKIVVYTRVP